MRLAASATPGMVAAMDIIDGAALTIRRAIEERFPLGTERDAWLRWLDRLSRASGALASQSPRALRNHRR
jgi:hypothetical protein